MRPLPFDKHADLSPSLSCIIIGSNCVASVCARSYICGLYRPETRMTHKITCMLAVRVCITMHLNIA